MALNTGSRTINATKNAAVSLINKLCILVLTFISRKFFIQYIGVEYLGINGLFANVLTLLSLADLGLGTAMNVSLYKPIAENDTKKLAALLSYFRTIYYFVAAGVTVVGLGLIPFLKYIVNLDKDIPHIYLYYSMFVIKNAVSYLFVYKSAIIRADQRNYVVNRIDIYVNIAKVVLQCIVIVAFKMYFLYLLLEVLCVLAHNLVVSHIANRDYPFIKNREELSKSEKKGIFSDISSVFLYKIAWSLINGTDNILMSVIVGTIYVGMYSNYSALTRNTEMFVALMFTSLTASIGNLVATSSPERRYKTFQSMQMVSFWLCGIITVCLFFLTQDFIQLWFGKELLLDNLVLTAIVLNSFFSNCMRPVWSFREGTGMYKQIRFIMFATAILNLILSIVLGKLLGLSGILFATSISKFLTYFWYEPNILFKNFFKVSPSKYYMGYVTNAVVLLIIVIVCFIPISFLKEVTVMNWIIKAVICFVVINVVYYIRYRNTEEFDNIKKKVRVIFDGLPRRKK